MQTKDFAKFAVLVVIAYAGFSSAFSVLGRDHYTLGRMNWVWAIRLTSADPTTDLLRF